MRFISQLLCCTLVAGSTSVWADALEGNKEIVLTGTEGERIVVATITLEPKGDYTQYEIAWRESPFADHFLSMRPFRCLEGPDKHWCQVPYPYENQRRITADDLTDLEYDLLFLWKGATDYGINMWNGVYYKLAIEEGRIVGALHEMDMDLLSAPPTAGNLRPLLPKHLHEADPDSHWLPQVVIE